MTTCLFLVSLCFCLKAYSLQVRFFVGKQRRTAILSIGVISRTVCLKILRDGVVCQKIQPRPGE
jgi:hypothetical protein